MARAKINLREFLGPAALRSKRRRPLPPEYNPSLQALWDAVAMIPRGQVATYGDVARLAGLPGRARQAGYALRITPPELELPWHRVVGAGGRIVFPKSSAQFREQSRRLRSEGVKVVEGRVDPAAMLTV